MKLKCEAGGAREGVQRRAWPGKCGQFSLEPRTHNEAHGHAEGEHGAAFAPQVERREEAHARTGVAEENGHEQTRMTSRQAQREQLAARPHEKVSALRGMAGEGGQGYRRTCTVVLLEGSSTAPLQFHLSFFIAQSDDFLFLWSFSCRTRCVSKARCLYRNSCHAITALSK